jgi:hypothetical protein
VNFLFRQWGHPSATSNFMEIFALMARYSSRRSDCRIGNHRAGCGHAHH